MDISLEDDADALWQDTLDLLADEGQSEAVLAMLRSCTPVSMDDGTLKLETPMRLVLKTVAKNTEALEAALSQAAFEPMKLEVSLGGSKSTPKPVAAPSNTMSPSAARSWEEAKAAPAPKPREEAPIAPVRHSETHAERMSDEGWREDADRAEREARERKAANPLVEDAGEADSKLTFDRFVQGDENILAYESAVQVANGVNRGYNLVFIYGKSGLGKTHLLRAIQNYIAKNDPSRVCVYKDASSFITDYVNASRSENKSAADELRHHYADIDVLIIDDVQMLAGKAGTINFFFDTFNTLRANGKWIVLAADRTPAELGMGKEALDERVTSRMGAGVLASVMVPSYELKVRLIEKFCERANEDARREHVDSLTGAVPSEIQEYMAEKAGNNIRVIEGFCQRCIIAATAAQKKGLDITREVVDDICREMWPQSSTTVSIAAVQKYIERAYDVTHEELIGNRRNKALMEARHVAIWLCRDLCEQTLADIGKQFGGRSHATVMHSLRVVEDLSDSDHVFKAKVIKLKEGIIDGA